MNKKLYRKTEGQMICGVCTGLAEYMEMDVSLVRIIAVLSAFFSGAGILAYIIAALIMPVDNQGGTFYTNPNNNYNNNNNNNNSEKTYENSDNNTNF